MNQKDLTRLIGEAFSIYQLDYELVEVEFLKDQGQRVLRVTIDKPGGIQLADCEKVNRVLDSFLDEKDPIQVSYNLEVSSPGIERPLKKASDFERFTGLDARVHTFSAVNGSKKWEGVLRGISGEEVLLEVEGEVLRIPLAMISRSHLIFRF